MPLGLFLVSFEESIAYYSFCLSIYFIDLDLHMGLILFYVLHRPAIEARPLNYILAIGQIY